MKRKSFVALGCLLVLIVPALVVLLRGQLEKSNARRKDAKKEEIIHKSKAKKRGRPKNVFFSMVKVVEVSADNEDSLAPNKGQGRIPFIAKVKGIKAYFHYMLRHGGQLVLTKGADFKVKGRIELQNDKLVLKEEKKEGAFLGGKAVTNARDVTEEVARLLGSPSLPFGATRAILVWPAQVSRRLQDGLHATPWAKDARKFYGIIELKDGHLVITLKKVVKKDGTVKAISYILTFRRPQNG